MVQFPRGLAGLRLPLLAWLILAVAACGSKTLPRPIDQQAKPEIATITAQVKNAQVLLNWTLAAPLPVDPKAGPYAFAVNRATIAPQTDCPECPPAAAERVAELDPTATASGTQPGLKTFSWTDKTSKTGLTYRYQVVLLDSKQRPLGRSEPVQATLLSPPAAPRKLKTTVEARGIWLQWQPPKQPKQSKASKAKGEQPAALRFVVERSSGPAGWAVVSTEPIQGNSFLDSAVADGGNYAYRVISLLDQQGVYVWGESAESRVVIAAKQMKPPPPQTVWVIPDQGKLQIHWTLSEGATTGYHVYRKQDGEISRLTLTPIAGPPFVDDNAAADTIYSYAISAVAPQEPHEEGLLSKWVEFRNLAFQ